MIELIEKNFTLIPGGTTIDENLTIPDDIEIPSGLAGWVKLFILQLVNYFDISLERIYNITIIQNKKFNTNSPSDTNSPSNGSIITNIGGIGIITPGDNLNKTSSINISFYINNNPNTQPMDNDYLSAVAVGIWMVNYFKGFIGSDTTSFIYGFENTNEEDFPNKNSFPDVIQPPIIGMQPKKTPKMKKDILGRPDMSIYTPEIINPIDVPDVFSLGPSAGPSATILQFTSQINNIFKKRNNNKKIKEHFGGDTVIGKIIYETDPDNITPMLVAPSGYNSRTGEYSKFQLNFTLNDTDFNTTKSELINIWNRMKKYLPNTGFTFFGTPSSLPDGTTVASGASGFIEEFLDVYSKILQVSNTRFTNITVKPNGGDYSIQQPTSVEYFEISVIITNDIGQTYEKNDYLDAYTIGTWLLYYWSIFKDDMTELPPFLPVPVQITPNVEGIGQRYTIELDKPLDGPTPLSLYETTMVNPLSTFIGGVDKSIDIIKLTSRIKNLSSPSIKNFSEHFSSDNKLLEHITTGSNPTTSSYKYSILDYIFQFSYITCFFGAVVLSVSQIAGWDIIMYIFNDTFTYWIYIYIGICSVIALFSWFNTSIWYVDSNIVNSANVAVNIYNSSFFK